MTQETQNDAPMVDNKVIPVMREAVTTVQMILFKVLREKVHDRYDDQNEAYHTQLAGAVINNLFGTQAMDEGIREFATANRELVERELHELKETVQHLVPIITDALRMKTICDNQEGIHSIGSLLIAKALGFSRRSGSCHCHRLLCSRFVRLRPRTAWSNLWRRRLPPKGNQRSPPPTCGIVSQTISCNCFYSFQQGMHRAPQCAGALAVDNPHLYYSQTLTFRKIFWYQGFDILGGEGVQVKDAINGKDNRDLFVFFTITPIVHFFLSIRIYSITA